MTPVQPFMPGFEAEERRRDLSQFYTPPWLAERVWRWMWRPSTCPLRVLEPSAGRGALIKPLFTLGIAVEHISAYDVDPGNVVALEQLAAETRAPMTVRARDFMADVDLLGERFDLSCMNPPFESNQDVQFIERVCQVCTSVAAVCQARIVHSAGRAEFWRWHDIRREAVLIERPQFGGDFSPATDFVVLDIVRRARARLQGEACALKREWWSS